MFVSGSLDGATLVWDIPAHRVLASRKSAECTTAVAFSPDGSMALTGSFCHGRHRHSTLALAVIGCRPIGIYTVILLSFFVEMKVSPLARLVRRPRALL
jgi:hypothetical protein